MGESKECSASVEERLQEEAITLSAKGLVTVQVHETNDLISNLRGSVDNLKRRLQFAMNHGGDAPIEGGSVEYQIVPCPLAESIHLNNIALKGLLGQINLIIDRLEV